MTNRSSPWIIAAICAIIVFGGPLIAASALVERDPEIRVIRSGDSFSALIVTDAARALVVNSTDQRIARSTIGLLSRPWEPDPTTLIAPADDRAAAGLWEAMKHPGVQQILIVGLPGAEPIWAEIERESRSRNVMTTYIAEESLIEMGSLILTVAPQMGDSAPLIAVRRHNAVVHLALTADVPANQSNVAVVNADLDGPVPADLAIVFRIPKHEVINRMVVAGNREVVQISMASDEIRVRGGRLFLVEAPAN